MADRAGPPTPRTDPAMYAKRDAAWRSYFDANGANWTLRDAVIARSGFETGWAARKAAEYSQIVNHAGIDKSPALVATLFPTEAELNAPVGSEFQK